MTITSTEVKTLKVALFALALGTMVEGFSQGISFLGSGVWGIIGAAIVALVFVTLFDLTATKNMFRVAKHHTGQEPLGRKVWIFYIAMSLGLVGTMAFSLLSVPVITDISVGDTDADKVMMEQKQAAEARHNGEKSDAERIYKDAQARVKAAQEYVTPKRGKFSPAKSDAIKAQGGNFAQLALDGNAWVWTSDAPFAKQRKAVAAAEAAALADLQAAKMELEEARKLRSGIVSRGAIDSATNGILEAQQKRFEMWTFKRATTRTVTLVIVWGSLVVVLISIIAQAAQGKVEEVRTISDVAADSLESIHDAFIQIMDAGNIGIEWARSKTFGFIAQPSIATKSQQQTTPVAPAPVPFIAPTIAQQQPPQQPANIATFVAPSQQKTQQRKRNTGATKNPLYLSARSAIRNARTAINKAQRDYENGAIDAEQLAAIITTKQAAIARNEKRAAQLKNRKQ